MVINIIDVNAIIYMGDKLMTLVKKLRIIFSKAKNDKKSYFDINALEYKITYDKPNKRYLIYTPMDLEPICVVNQKDEFFCFLDNILNHRGEIE